MTGQQSPKEAAAAYDDAVVQTVGKDAHRLAADGRHPRPDGRRGARRAPRLPSGSPPSEPSPHPEGTQRVQHPPRADAVGARCAEAHRSAGPAQAATPAQRQPSRARSLPAVVLLVVFLLGPVISSFYGSFTNSALTGAGAADQQFVGFENYVELFQDPDFPKSVILTVVFLFASAVVGQNVLGLGLALLMRSANKVVRSIVGTFVVAAWVLPEIVAVVRRVRVLQRRGHAQHVPVVVRHQRRELALHVPDARGHPREHLARDRLLDARLLGRRAGGAPRRSPSRPRSTAPTGWQRLVYITLPVIRRSISTNLMLTTLQTLSVFTLIYVMTGGGPGTNSLDPADPGLPGGVQVLAARLRDRDRDHHCSWSARSSRSSTSRRSSRRWTDGITATVPRPTSPAR